MGQPYRPLWASRRFWDFLKPLPLLAALLAVCWLQRPEREPPPSASSGSPAAQPASARFEVQTTSLPPAPQDPVELAAHELASRIADEQDALSARQTLQQQVLDKQAALRRAVAERDQCARQVQDAQRRAADKAQLAASEQGLLPPLMAADRQARARLFDEEAAIKQCEMDVTAFSAAVAALNLERSALAAQRDSLQAELEREVSLLPVQLESLELRLRRQGDAYLLRQAMERAQQRQERDLARERFGELCQLFSRQDEPQRESRHASHAVKHVENVIAAHRRQATTEGLARQTSLRGQLASVEQRLALKQRDLDRQQQYLDEAWKVCDARQSALRVARLAQARTGEALRAAEEQVAARQAEMLSAQQEAAALMPALATAEAKVQAASAEVDRWVERLAAAQGQLEKARGATRDARTSLYAQKAAAQSEGGLLTALQKRF